jgi:ADP-ribose pyrophosphatase
MKLKLLKRNNLYQGKVFSTIVDDVEYPSGRKGIREVAQHPGGAAILAMFPDQTILMIRQHRYPLDKFIWELPAGKLEPGEDPLHCAKRELEEETGYAASQWEKIAAIYTTPGFCDEKLHLFLAKGLTPLPDGRKLEEGEQSMELHILPFNEVKSMIQSGEIQDAKTICAILMVENRIAK